jgi:serine/threonine-protein kinase RsbT
MHFSFEVLGDDFSRAGFASAEIKKILIRLGVPNDVIKRTAVAMYEAEINMVVHAGGGEAEIDVESDRIVIVMRDQGPGIADVELAMQDGYSTAPQVMRELGFGAGMGLANMKRNADEMKIDTEVGTGTTVTMTIFIPEKK